MNKRSEIDSLGTLSYLQEDDVVMVVLNHDYSIENQQLMWAAFRDEGSYPAHVDKFLLNCGDYVSIGSTLKFTAMDEWWYENFPGKKLAIVTSSATHVAVLKMAAKPDMLQPFSTLEGAMRWLQRDSFYVSEALKALQRNAI